MINSVRANSINRVNYANRANESQINAENLVSNPQVQCSNSSNLITNYLDNLARMNVVNVSKPREITTPSGIEGYDNYTEFDNFGNEQVSVRHAKDGDALVQTVKTKSADGTTVEKIISNSPNSKSLNLVIKDKDGNVLLTREKSRKTIDEDSSQTIVNGEVYNVSGLSGSVLKVEHNGKTVTLDLEKMLNDDVATTKDEKDNNIIRETKITPEEKEALFNKIKAFDGDDLFRLSQSVDSIQYYSGMDSFFVETDKSLQLQIDNRFKQDISVHELGHAFNHKNENKDKIDNNSLLSTSDAISNIRIQATNDYLNQKGNKNDNDQRFFSKFLSLDNYLNFYPDKETAYAVMQDEIFAESYNVLNTMDIVDYSGGMGCPGRVLSMLKYMPSALVEVEKVI